MGKAERHARDWEPTKLQAIIDARALANYTTHIVSNKKVFDPENDFDGSTLSLINITARNIYLRAWSANKIDARGNEQMFNERMRLQAEAIRLCDELLAIIEMSWTQFHVPSKKIYHWAKRTMAVEARLISWHNSDRTRLKSTLN